MDRKLTSILIAALMAFVPLAGAESESTTLVEQSQAVPTASDWVWNGETGFDWSARENRTHAMIDAANPINSIALDPIKSELIDLEVQGLPAGVPLRIVATNGLSQDNEAYADGTLVLWNMPAVPLTVTITERETGKVLTTAIMSSQMQMAGGTSSSGTNSMARPCGNCGSSDYSTRNSYNAYKWERANYPTYVNGARSFTADVRITIESCWKHVNSISATVSGGYAGASGTAGGTKTHTQSVCSATSSTNGFGQIAGPIQQFQKDTYADGSYKIYALAGLQGYSSVGWNWNPSKCCYTLEFQNCKTNPGQYYSLSEQNSGAIQWSGGYTAWGVSGSVTTSSTTDNQATVKFSCIAPDDAFHRYTFKVVAGDGWSSGMVGAVWKEF